MSSLQGTGGGSPMRKPLNNERPYHSLTKKRFVMNISKFFVKAYIKIYLLLLLLEVFNVVV